MRLCEVCQMAVPAREVCLSLDVHNEPHVSCSEHCRAKVETALNQIARAETNGTEPPTRWS